MKEELHLEGFDAEQLLAELRYRSTRRGDATSGDSPLRLSPDLARFRSEDIYDFLVARQLTVYGVDNRKDLFEVTDSNVQRVADGVVAVLDDVLVTPNADGTSRISTETYGVVNGLCASEPFFNQPACDEHRCCTGFLVAPQVILTAGHCVDHFNLSNRRFVFGYKMRDAVSPMVFDIPNYEIYRGRELIAWNCDPRGDDFAVVLVDRIVRDHRPLPIRRTGEIASDQPVYVIGHPMALPLKFAEGARVTRNEDASFFVANLDTYTANSGSPVLNYSHEVEGILVRGATDFVPVGDCLKSLVCPIVKGQSDCTGEECMRIARIAHLVP